MQIKETRPKVESAERESEYFYPDYPSGLFCYYCSTELTRWEASHNRHKFGYLLCIDCNEEEEE